MNANPAGDRWYQVDRRAGLRRFAGAITVLNILGHLWFGFEQSWAQLCVGVATAYAVELALELVESNAQRRSLCFGGSLLGLIDFLLPAHITGVAVSMLLYANQGLAPIAFAAAVAIASKSVFRVSVGGRERHFLNPSNFGIACTLLLFPWVGIAPPYMFTENLSPLGSWLLPFVVIVLGTLLNIRFTHRLPLIVAWISTFALQGTVRHLVLGQPLVATFLPMTGMAFLLFTFYMVTDPPTTPSDTRGQVLFGAAVAVAYGCLMALHIVFGLFFALAVVSSCRGAWLHARALALARGRARLMRIQPTNEPGVEIIPTARSAAAPERSPPQRVSPVLRQRR